MLGFSVEWDECYSLNRQLAIWPWSDLVSLVNRHCKQVLDQGNNAKVLELGCGAGANIPFFRASNVNYSAIEGSASVVRKLHAAYPDIAAKIIKGDFTLGQNFGSNYDLIFDRASITHNDTRSIRNVLRHVKKSLKPGGTFIGIDWFSTNHSDYYSGRFDGDKFTRNGYTRGQFEGVGRVHFSDEEHLQDLFYEYQMIFLEEKLVKRTYPIGSGIVASWNIVVKNNDA